MLHSSILNLEVRQIVGKLEKFGGVCKDFLNGKIEEKFLTGLIFDIFSEKDLLMISNILIPDTKFTNNLRTKISKTLALELIEQNRLKKINKLIEKIDTKIQKIVISIPPKTCKDGNNHIKNLFKFEEEEKGGVFI